MRILHDMTAKELAKKFEISVGQLSKIEQGKATPQMALIEKYAKEFQTTPASLMLFAEDLDKEKKRGKLKISIRNTMFKLLKALGGVADVETSAKNPSKK
jgi:transcriptional regulator with XRE-family HTH domain